MMTDKLSSVIQVVDIHCHILSGVDDGAENVEESLRMLDMEVEQGATAVVLTPHYGKENGYEPSAELVAERYAELKELAAERYPDLRLYLGSEVFCVPGAEARIEQGLTRSMAGTRYALFEFTEWGGVHETAETIVERMLHIAARGVWLPILAHAERYRSFEGKSELYRKLVDGGVYLQVNAYDLYENSSDATRLCAQWLVQNRLAHFIGSDGHRVGRRPPVLRSGAEWVRDNCESDYAHALLHGNAQRMLRGEVVVNAQER
jgi:protein-tyrosine phosphatase